MFPDNVLKKMIVTTMNPGIWLEIIVLPDLSVMARILSLLPLKRSEEWVSRKYISILILKSMIINKVINGPFENFMGVVEEVFSEQTNFASQSFHVRQRYTGRIGFLS